MSDKMFSESAFPELPLEKSPFVIPLSRLISGRAGFIDLLEVTDERVIVEGWSLCLDSKKIELPQKLYVVYDTEVIGIAAFSVERHDVLEAFKIDEPSLCGFRFSLPASRVENLHSIEMIAEDSYGNLYQLIKGKISGLQLELTGRCNLKCLMCPSVSFSDFHMQDMTLDDLELIKPLFLKIDQLCFDGFGEALLAKNFDSFICSVPRLKELTFHTNGLLLNKKKEVIFKNSPPLRSVIVSLDSLIPEVYEKIRRGSNLRKVLKNIEDVIDRRNANGQHFPRVIPNITIMKNNYLELPSFVRLAADLDRIVEFNFLYDSAVFDEFQNNQKEKFNYAEQMPKNYAKAVNDSLYSSMEIAKKLDVDIRFNGSHLGYLEETFDIYGFAGKKAPIKECPYMRPYYMLQADGFFQFCVWQTSPVFNWRETRNVDPFDDSRGRTIKDLIMRGTVPKECGGAGCMWVGRKPSDELSNDIIKKGTGGFSGTRL